MPTIGNRLKELRATTGKSQQVLSEMAGSTQSSINRFENDQSEALYKVLLWYADYFDVSNRIYPTRIYSSLLKCVLTRIRL